MHVVLLGTAAGGGFPQWNCWCPCCRVARTDPQRAVPRTQSSAAVSADGARWFLLNASPDVREQLARLPEPASWDLRRSPVAGIVLTDGELDHTLGITLLRETRRLGLYATCAVETIVEHDSRVLAVTRAFADVELTELPVDAPVALRYPDRTPSGLSVEAFPVPAGPPRFARQEQRGHTVGLIVTEEASGRRVGFVPGCGGLDDQLLGRLAETDLLLFDGTFWHDDELIALGIGERRARDMDHLPISGMDGSLERLARLRRPRVVYSHLNNTNPVLLEESPERAAVAQRGITVGQDGMAWTL